MEDCIFCKIVAKEIPSEIVYETDDVLSFKDMAPSAPIHYLIIPKKHLANLSDTMAADQGLVDNVMLAITKIAEKLGVSAAYKATTNNGENAGQVVPHFHFHLLAGWKNKVDATLGIYKISNNDRQ